MGDYTLDDVKELITNINDIRKLKSKNLYGAICGKSIYEGTLDLKQAVEACND